MLTIRDTLLWYKRLDVRKAMLLGAQNKEIGVRYGEGFGKRPDSLEYEQEILDAVQQGATSFHASEELWTNPRLIETGMSKQQLDELRTGWDLVFDIDFTSFEATKHITDALCKLLEQHSVKHYGVKFSGNKGFHVGIAWESFPEMHGATKTSTLFPDAARQIANYIVHHLDNPENNFALSDQLRGLLTGAEIREHTIIVCAKCGRDRIEKTLRNYYVCRKCGHTETTPEDIEYLQCAVCASFMEKLVHEQDSDKACVCGSSETREKIDLKIDTQLISSRHLYRLEYCMHEKSGLVSVPISESRIIDFQRDEARPERVKTFSEFWNRTATGEVASLLAKAMVFRAVDSKDNAEQKEVVWESEAAPEAAFPPAIKKMLAGMSDGRKRALFILTNFLRSVGWNYEMIEERLEEWNKANREPLKEVVLKGHLRYHKQRGTVILPPNFDNDIYKDLGVLEHDELSAKMKNPVQYVRLRLKQSGDRKTAKKKHREVTP